MNRIVTDFSKNVRPMKKMHGVNNGPMRIRNMDNIDLYREAGIPYARLHDTMYPYGSGHYVDIPCVFPNFEADPNDKNSYDFDLTDEYINDVYEAGSEVFYRLGVSIEHAKKKYHVMPPKDYEKWAKICEGIIRHYTEDLKLKITYWEIWNEPDLDGAMWTGTVKEFYDLYKTTAIYLKKCFPNLKIGGYAACDVKKPFHTEFFELLSKEKERVPMDFFSWHIYTNSPDSAYLIANKVDQMLEKYNYGGIETFLDEWNYVENWADMLPTYKAIHSMRGAAFTASVLCLIQKTNLKGAMYYDGNPNSTWCNLFDYPYLLPLKGYYAIKAFNELYKLKNEVFSNSDVKNTYILAAKNENQAAVIVCDYRTNKEQNEDNKIEVDLSEFYDENGVKLEIYLVDEQNDMALVDEQIYFGKRFTKILNMKPDTFVLIKLEKI